jgi:hypothetical protein
VTAWWESTKDDWRTMPWTPRARRIGHVIQLTVAFVAIVFGPAVVTAGVNWLVP